MSHNPEWSGEYEGWTVNFLKANYWRVASTMEREDALQEARLLFYRLRCKYKVEEPAHFMALFKTSFVRRFHDLSNDNSRHFAHQPSQTTDEAYQRDPIGSTDTDGYLLTLLRQAPREVSMVLSLFLNAPQELLDHALGAWAPSRDGRRTDGGSGPVNRLLGFPDDFDSLAAVQDYLT